MDLGYRGNNYQGEAKVNIVNLSKQKNKPKKLKGRDGNHINAFLAAFGFNLRKLYNVFPAGMKFHLLPILNLIAKRFLTNIFDENPKYSFFPNNFLARFCVFQ